MRNMPARRLSVTGFVLAMTSNFIFLFSIDKRDQQADKYTLRFSTEDGVVTCMNIPGDSCTYTQSATTINKNGESYDTEGRQTIGNTSVTNNHETSREK